MARRTGPLDADLQLMDSQTIAETGDSEGVIDHGAGFAPEPDAVMRLELEVEALDTGDENETYEVDVQESDDDDTYVSTGLKFAVEAVGQISKAFGQTKRYTKLVWTLAGTTPSVTASAWLQRA